MTDYFNSFPTFINKDKNKITDIMRRLVYIQQTNPLLFEDYILRDGDKPENVAYRYYGDTKYFWVILFVNQMYNPFYDWLLSASELDVYITKKYGVGNEDAIHHWETTIDLEPTYRTGTVVDVSFPQIAQCITVSNREYENRKNEAKRKIKILKRSQLSVITELFARIMNG